MENIQTYQKKCFAGYKTKIGYPSFYTYLHGQPINPLVPIETPINGIMVVGAYPSAKFYNIKSDTGKIVSDVPVCDNDAPFSNESYFDGSRVRTIPSGKELNEVILAELGVSRQDCWITDLVKVFLFKPGHVERYIKLGKTDIGSNRKDFMTFADKSMHFLEQEISIASPRVILLLGSEVSHAIFQTGIDKAKYLMNGEVLYKNFGGKDYPVFCLPHPGILMKKSDHNPWPGKFVNEIAPNVKAFITIALGFERA